MEEETINEFTSLKGVGESKARALYEAGYHSIEDLDDATVEELSRIEGITQALAESIKEQVDDLFEEVEVEEAEVEEAEVEEAEVEEAEVEEAEVEEAEVEEAEVEEAEAEEAEAEVAEAEVAEVEVAEVEVAEAEVAEAEVAEAEVAEVEVAEAEVAEAEVAEVEVAEAEVAEAEVAEAEVAEVEETEAEAAEIEEEEEEIIEVPTAELVLDPETSRLLKVRRRQKQKKPHFVQTDQHKKKRLKDTWRRPRGLHNKKRRYILGKGEMARVGYGSPAGAKGLHPSGFQEVHLKRIQDLDDVDPNTQAIRIARTLGQRKRLEIVKKARSLGLKILNPPYEGGEE